MRFPVGFEAFLGTEKRSLDPQLDARRTLQLRRLFAAGRFTFAQSGHFTLNRIKDTLYQLIK